MWRYFFSSIPVPFVPPKTPDKLSHFYVNMRDIIHIIPKFNAGKATGPDGISICMLKLCPDEASYILKVLFERIIETGVWPEPWKMADVQPVHKKGSRQLVKNYRSISLLPISSKILEKNLFDQMYKFFVNNNLISQYQ